MEKNPCALTVLGKTVYLNAVNSLILCQYQNKLFKKWSFCNQKTIVQTELTFSIKMTVCGIFLFLSWTPLFFFCVLIPILLCSTWFLIWFFSPSFHECWLQTPLLNNRIYKPIYIVITTWSWFPGCYLCRETAMLENNEQRVWVSMTSKRNRED